MYLFISLTTYARTGFRRVIKDLRKLGIGNSYTEMILRSMGRMGICAIFVDSKQLKKTSWQHNVCFNTESGRLEAHHTSAVLVQKYNLENDLANVYLEPDLVSKGNAIDPVKVRVMNYQVLISNVDLVNYKITIQI